MEALTTAVIVAALVIVGFVYEAVTFVFGATVAGIYIEQRKDWAAFVAVATTAALMIGPILVAVYYI